jgi:hypothetical protein
VDELPVSRIPGDKQDASIGRSGHEMILWKRKTRANNRPRGFSGRQICRCLSCFALAPLAYAERTRRHHAE